MRLPKKRLRESLILGMPVSPIRICGGDWYPPHNSLDTLDKNGVVDPAKDMYPGAGHEWFSIQHWISVQQDGLSATVMPLDAPLATFGDINRGEWPTEFGLRAGNIFSYAMNNYWHTNYRAAQGGHFRFRYVITSATHTDAAALGRMGWESDTARARSNPLAGQGAGSTSAAQWE
jgi:hypothetical protein